MLLHWKNERSTCVQCCHCTTGNYRNQLTNQLIVILVIGLNWNQLNVSNWFQLEPVDYFQLVSTGTSWPTGFNREIGTTGFNWNQLPIGFNWTSCQLVSIGTSCQLVSTGTSCSNFPIETSWQLVSIGFAPIGFNWILVLGCKPSDLTKGTNSILI